MNQTKDQIEALIDHARMELNSNLHELEERATSAMDWKQHFDAKPGTLLAAAFVGGIALSLLIGGSGGGRRRPRYTGTPPLPQPRAARAESEMWNRVKGALIGLAAARITDYVGHIIPAASPQTPKESR
jgi:hypothetical protein